MPIPSAETIQTVLTILAALAAGFWRLGRSIYRLVQGIERLGERVAITVQGIDRLDERVAVLVKAVDDVADHLGDLEYDLRQRAADTTRLEGRLEQTTVAIHAAIGDTKGVQASVDALWRTLQALHPIEIPPRVSDASARRQGG